MPRRNIASGSPYEPIIGFSRAVRIGKAFDEAMLVGTAQVIEDAAGRFSPEKLWEMN